MIPARTLVRGGLIALALLLCAGIAAPFIHADRFAAQIQPAIERAIGRRVEIGDVRFTLLTGPGFSIGKVSIHEDAALGIEPVAYVETLRAGVRLWSLWTGRLEFSSLVLDEASINLSKSDASGRWNFERLLSRADLSRFPTVSVRDGRINFKFGETKSTFYLTQADMDITPPGVAGGPWSIRFEGAPARTDRPSRAFGGLQARGRWTPRGRIDMDLRLDRNALADISSVLRGHDAGVHGELSASVHLDGTLDDVALSGAVKIEDVHRWDMLPPNSGDWPFLLKGRLDIVHQRLELEAAPAVSGVPISVRVRATDYLSTPHWGLAVTWKRFPVEPLLQVARHMGVMLPRNATVGGWVEGVVGYAAPGGVQGELGFYETRLALPGSPPLRFEEARLLFDDGSVSLLPSAASTPEGERATVEGRWTWNSGAWDFRVATASMDVSALRAQAALAAVPWIEQLQSGTWSGELRYRFVPEDREATGWRGRVSLTGAALPVPGLAAPIRLESAQASIDRARVSLDRMSLRAGEFEAHGDYRYEPSATHPHRFRLLAETAAALEIERLLAPVLRRRAGLLSRALRLGRAPVPDWLAGRRAEGSLRFGRLTVGGVEFEDVSAGIVWDGTQVSVAGLQARTGETRLVSGGGAINLRKSFPEYRVFAKWEGLDWQYGVVNGESIVQTSGTGRELLTNLRSGGVFSGRAVQLPTSTDAATLKGAYELRWTSSGPRIRLAGLQLATAAAAYTGQGRTGEDGRLIVELASGARELRMSGPLAKLQMDGVATQ
jgi:hypothetical protein